MTRASQLKLIEPLSIDPAGSNADFVDRPTPARAAKASAPSIIGRHQRRRRWPGLKLLSDLISMRHEKRSAEICDELGISAKYMRLLLHIVDIDDQTLLAGIRSGAIPVSIAVQIGQVKCQENRSALQRAYETGKLRGNALITVRLLMSEQERLASGPPRQEDIPWIERESTRRTLKQGIKARQQRLAKAAIVLDRLNCAIRALGAVLDDQEFRALLEEQGIAAIPGSIANELAKLRIRADTLMQDANSENSAGSLLPQETRRCPEPFHENLSGVVANVAQLVPRRSSRFQLAWGHLCVEAQLLLENSSISELAVIYLKGMTADRQIEVVKLMLATQRITRTYIRILLVATPAAQLKYVRGQTKRSDPNFAEISELAREWERLDRLLLEDMPSQQRRTLVFVVVRTFVARLLGARPIIRYLNASHPEACATLQEFAVRS